MAATLTVIIHGTFASEERWWRPGSKDAPTFADDLENALSRRKLVGTVWNPDLLKEFDHDAFAWAGGNRHRDRMRGARKLASRLNQVAEHCGASPSDPLIVNFVGHSHGGNVALEALRGLAPTVRVGRVVLLGTPLVTVKPAFRIGRFVTSISLLALLFTIVIITLLVPVHHSYNILSTWSLPHPTSTDITLLYTLLFLLISGWSAWLVGNALNVAWRVMCRPFRPLRGTVYGPSMRRLATILNGDPLLLINARNDESDVLLWTTSNLTQNYKLYLVGRMSKISHLLEYIFLRPLVYGNILRVAEMLLERFVLGFPLWRLWWLDYAVSPPNDHAYYPKGMLTCQDVDIPESTIHKIAARAPRTLEDVGVQQPGLISGVNEVVRFIREQVKLRHCLYYETGEIIERTANFLTEGEAKLLVKGEANFLAEGGAKFLPEKGVEPAVMLEGFWETLLVMRDGFWELLLVMNVGLGAFWFWAGSQHERNMGPEEAAAAAVLATIFGYVFPFTVLSFAAGCFRLAMHRMPVQSRRERWFWSGWALSLLCSLALGLPLALAA